MRKQSKFVFSPPGRFLATIVLTLLAACSWPPGEKLEPKSNDLITDAQAERIEQMLAGPEIQQARAALRRFNETPKFLAVSENKNTQDLVLSRQELESRYADNCESPHKSCFTYVTQYPQEILAYLPNNPAYWQNFWLFLETRDPGYDTTWGRPLNPELNLHPIMDASLTWPKYITAKHGYMPLDQALQYNQHLRRLLGQSLSIAHYTILIVGHGSSIEGLNFAIAQHIKEHGKLPSGFEVPQPLTPEESSFLALSQMELYIGERVNPLPNTPEELYEKELLAYNRVLENENITNFNEPAPELLTPREFAERVKEDDFYRQGAIAAMNGAVQISLRSDAQFWADGADAIELGLIEEPDIPKKYQMDNSYRSYLAFGRINNLSYHILNSLTDMYMGLTPKGSPKQEPPKHWSWRWNDDSSSLCLYPVDIHPSLERWMYGDSKVCMRYLLDQY